MNQDEQSHALLDELRERIDLNLMSVVDETRSGVLFNAVRYVLKGKGKRVRPMLTMLGGGIFGASREMLIDAAVAIEVFHSFTLVHDDIMDKSVLRRGQETVHVKWDESTAILVGDYMLGLVYEQLSKSRSDRLRDILRIQSETVEELCEGQLQDMQFESRSDVSVDEYLEKIGGKTGKLLSSALQIGGLIGNANEEDLNRLSQLGLHLGRAFQIQDDLLDVTAPEKQWGKPVGGDLIAGKKTYLLLAALEREEGSGFSTWRNVVDSGGIAPDGVADARERLEGLGILTLAREAVHYNSTKALQIVSVLPESSEREALVALIESLRNRSF